MPNSQRFPMGNSPFPLCPTLLPMRHLPHSALAVLLPVALGACAGPLNNEHGIGNAGRPFGHSVYTPATLADATVPPPPEGLEPTTNQQLAPVYGAAGPVDARTAQPSLTSLDRSNWGATAIEVPNDFPAHQPRLAGNYLNKESNPRAQGKYPTERTALGLGTDRHNDEQLLEAAAAPFVAGADILLFIPRAIVEMRPYQPTRTGGEGYARMPSNVVIVNPSIEPNGPVSRIRTLPPLPSDQSITDPGAAPTSGAPRKPAGKPPRALQPPADDLRPGGGMPATDVAPAPQAPAAPASKP
jgi:hypothetical protein